jgi:anti-anti-sigma factor
MGDGLRIDVKREGGTAHIIVGGAIDIATGPRLRSALERLSEDSAVRKIVIDLRDVSFIDATGMSLLATADAASRRDGFNLSVVKAAPLIHRLFVLTGMDQRLAMLDGPPVPDSES